MLTEAEMMADRVEEVGGLRGFGGGVDVAAVEGSG